jgi:hypothetical protein
MRVNEIPLGDRARQAQQSRMELGLSLSPGFLRANDLDAHHGDGKRFVVRADEKLTAFLELESAIKRDHPEMPMDSLTAKGRVVPFEKIKKHLRLLANHSRRIQRQRQKPVLLRYLPYLLH